MMRPGTFWSGLTTLIVLAIPILAGFGLWRFFGVYESGQYVTLCGYGLIALAALLGYRYAKVKAGPGGVEIEVVDEED